MGSLVVSEAVWPTDRLADADTIEERLHKIGKEAPSQRVGVPPAGLERPGPGPAGLRDGRQLGRPRSPGGVQRRAAGCTSLRRPLWMICDVGLDRPGSQPVILCVDANDLVLGAVGDPERHAFLPEGTPDLIKAWVGRGDVENGDIVELVAL